MKSRKLLAFPLLAATMVFAAACGSTEPADPGTGSSQTEDSGPAVPGFDINTQPREAVTQGGELRLAVSDFGYWNPMSVDGNNDDLSEVRSSLLPQMIDVDDEGVPVPDPRYTASAELTQDDPSVVSWKINPDAKWGDGTPLSWRDFEAMWKACGQGDEEFTCASTQGYDQIESITAGENDQEAVITFKGAYPDWTQPFTQLVRAESIETPEVFNEGWTELKPEWLAGPFTVESYDATQKVITVVPSDTWWGEAPLLDKITWRAISPDATANAFVNNELDSFDVGPDPDAYAKSMGYAEGTVRKAAGPNFRHITFNTKAGHLQELEVRQAIIMGLDRASIGASDLAGIDWPAEPLNNNIFLATQDQFVDMAEKTGITYDVAKAKQTLEGAGWTMNDATGVYEKDGEPLEVKFSQLEGVPVSENEARQVQDQLKAVGITVEIVSVPISKFQDGSLLTQHEFEMVAFSWIGTAYPYQFKQIYGSGQDSNFAQLDNPEIDALADQVDVELDQTKRTELANQAAELIWTSGHTLPLYQRPDLIATKKTLANFGAFGLKAPHWEDIGFMAS